MDVRSPKKYKLLIFDFDGTLRSISMEAMFYGWIAIFESLDLDHRPHFTSIEEFAEINHGDWRAMARSFGLKEEQLLLCNEPFAKAYLPRVRLYEWVHYVIPAIARLTDVKMAIWSNGHLESVLHGLGGYASFFKPIITADSVARLKPDAEGGAKIILHHLGTTIADRSEAILIGDDEVDLIVAQHMGIDAAFVTWGLGKLDLIVKYPCTVLTHPEELYNLVDPQKR